MADDKPALKARWLAGSARELTLRSELISVRSELQQLLDALERTHEEREPVQSAVVTSVVPRPLSLRR